MKQPIGVPEDADYSAVQELDAGNWSHDAPRHPAELYFLSFKHQSQSLSFGSSVSPAPLLMKPVMPVGKKKTPQTEKKTKAESQ